MPEFQVEGQELKKLVKAAKKQPMAFAFNPGASDEEHYFGLHRKKSPGVLGREAKQDGPGNKFSFGEMSVVGKEMQLTCERVLPAMAKKLKKWLKKQKVMLNVVVMDANGEILEQDIEDLPDDPDLTDETVDPEGSSIVASEQVEADSSPITPRLTSFYQRIKALPDESAWKLSSAFKGIVHLAQSGDVTRASDGADKLERVLVSLESATGDSAPESATPEDPVHDPQVKKFLKAVETLRHQTDQFEDQQRKARIYAVLDQAGALAQDGKADSALTILRKAQEAIKASGDAASNVDPDVKPYAKAQLSWRGARRTIGSELGKLQEAIIQTCNEDPELAGAIGKVGRLSEYLSALDDRLENALISITKKPQGEARDAARNGAMDIVKAYRRELDSEFFKVVDRGNGFVDVSIAATARKALDGVSSVLANHG